VALHPRTTTILAVAAFLVAVLLGWRPPIGFYVGAAMTAAISTLVTWLWNRGA